jgi:hypothetical protein
VQDDVYHMVRKINYFHLIFLFLTDVGWKVDTEPVRLRYDGLEHTVPVLADGPNLTTKYAGEEQKHSGRRCP